MRNVHAHTITYTHIHNTHHLCWGRGHKGLLLLGVGLLLSGVLLLLRLLRGGLLLLGWHRGRGEFGGLGGDHLHEQVQIRMGDQY
jgi:hypothetical protein